MLAKVEKNSIVDIEFVGKFKDGKVFDQTKDKAFSFTAGSNEVIAGMSQGVIGMKLGEEKIIEIPAAEAYGEIDEELFISIPKEKVPAEIKVGDGLPDEVNQGHTWWVKEVKPDVVILDGNHPFAGKDLVFEVKVVSIH